MPSVENVAQKLSDGSTAVDPAVAGHNENAKPALAQVKSDALFSLANQGIIVTGGARGLGLCVATALLESHASHVYCVDVLDSPSKEEWAIAEKVAAQGGAKIDYRKLDITDEEAVKRVIKGIYDECQYDVSGFFGAAGIQQMVPALDYPAKDFRRIMEVNVTGTFLTIQAAANEMKERNIKGSIVMTASMSGSIANKGLTCLAYNTSKAALLQMCRSAAAEWGHYGIRVNTLSPGYIRTAMTDGLLATRPDLEEEWLRGSMLERLSTPDEFRGPAVYLLSRASSFMTGADLIVDGGHTAF